MIDDDDFEMLLDRADKLLNDGSDEAEYIFERVLLSASPGVHPVSFARAVVGLEHIELFKNKSYWRMYDSREWEAHCVDTIERLREALLAARMAGAHQLVFRITQEIANAYGLFYAASGDKQMLRRAIAAYESAVSVSLEAENTESEATARVNAALASLVLHIEERDGALLDKARGIIDAIPESNTGVSEKRFISLLHLTRGLIHAHLSRAFNDLDALRIALREYELAAEALSAAEDLEYAELREAILASDAALLGHLSPNRHTSSTEHALRYELACLTYELSRLTGDRSAMTDLLARLRTETGEAARSLEELSPHHVAVDYGTGEYVRHVQFPHATEDGLRQVIEAMESALTRTPQYGYELSQATTLVGLGRRYLELAQFRDRVANLKMAADHLEMAVSIFTRYPGHRKRPIALELLSKVAMELADPAGRTESLEHARRIGEILINQLDAGCDKATESRVLMVCGELLATSFSATGTESDLRMAIETLLLAFRRSVGRVNVWHDYRLERALSNSWLEELPGKTLSAIRPSDSERFWRVD